MKNQSMIIAEPGKQEIFVMREFEAPREMVFKAFTDPELLMQWYLTPEHNMKIDFMNYKTGGTYRFIMPGINDKEVGISGVVHECLAPERIIKTFEYEGLPERGHVALEKTLFEALPNERTKVTVQFICESAGYRDGMVNSGMRDRYEDVHAALDKLLTKITVNR
jgi:uncharacterized protein YndB with AHSA1/START domain